ncbi:MAG: hypothetical protein C4345_00415, partial [Chloroflexota bacterium]
MTGDESTLSGEQVLRLLPAPSPAVRLARRLAPLTFLVLGLAVWEVWVHWADSPRWFLPPPSVIARTIVRDRALLFDNAWVTLQEIILGFFVALVAGILGAIAIHGSRVV